MVIVAWQEPARYPFTSLGTSGDVFQAPIDRVDALLAAQGDEAVSLVVVTWAG